MISEGRIRIEIPNGWSARKFDDPVDHGLSHCMKAVDFIMESETKTIFLEIKDPSAAQDNKTKAEYLERLKSGSVDHDLKYKFRDTFLYQYGLDRIGKPISYFVLINLDTLSSESLQKRTESLKREIPLSRKHEPWTKPFVTSCAVFNVETWNRILPQFSLTIT